MNAISKSLNALSSVLKPITIIYKSINIPLHTLIADLLRIIEKCKENICDWECIISNTLGGILYCVGAVS